jgi:hypothetical protein
MRQQLEGKCKAFLLHLAVSAAVTATLVALAAWRWFPLPYFVTDGGWQGIRLVAAIDVVLGPCITLVVYNRSKSWRALAFDYCVIGLLQVAALSFGIWTVFAQRTVMVVLADGAFYSVDAQTAVRLGGPGEAVLQGASTRPAYAVMVMPDDRDAQQALRRESLSTGRPLYMFSERLQPLDAAHRDLLDAFALDPAATAAGSPGAQDQFRDFLKQRPGSADDYVFLPVVSPYGGCLLAFSRGSPTPDGWLDIALKPPYKRRRKTVGMR